MAPLVVPLSDDTVDCLVALELVGSLRWIIVIFARGGSFFGCLIVYPRHLGAPTWRSCVPAVIAGALRHGFDWKVTPDKVTEGLALATGGDRSLGFTPAAVSGALQALAEAAPALPGSERRPFLLLVLDVGPLPPGLVP